jgi:hypothetical protein
MDWLTVMILAVMAAQSVLGHAGAVHLGGRDYAFRQRKWRANTIQGAKVTGIWIAFV